MSRYQVLLSEIIKAGLCNNNSGNIESNSTLGAILKYDLDNGIPAFISDWEKPVKTRTVFNSLVKELVRFLDWDFYGSEFSDCYVELGLNASDDKKWLENPYRTDDDDFGYGYLWNRGYGGNDFFFKAPEQLRNCLDAIMCNPTDKCIILHGWNLPYDQGYIPRHGEMPALPPIHLMYQFLPNTETGELSMIQHMQSKELLFRDPHNMAIAALLLIIVSRLTGYSPRWLTCFIGDSTNSELMEQVLKIPVKPFPSKKLVINDRVPEFHRDGYHPEWLGLVEPSDFTLVDHN